MKIAKAFFIVAAFMIVENSALMCYTCYNHRQEQCAVKKIPPLLANVNCKRTDEEEFKAGGRATCYKLQKAVWIGRDNVTYLYQRGCTVSGGKFDFCDQEYQKDPEMNCFLCHDDFCNDSPALKAVRFFLIVTVVLAILLS